MPGLGALPARFRRERVLVVGCGDVGMRLVRQARSVLGPRMLALTSSPQRVPALRAAGVTPLRGDLDDARSLGRLAGLAHRVVHLAPPPLDDTALPRRDRRTQRLLAALGRRSAPRAMVYGSTTGVYGDCEGAWVSETRAVAPQTARAWRRVDAEKQWRTWGRQRGVSASVLRIPGIYAPDRDGGTPRARLERGTPVLVDSQDVFTNHVHADDLASAVRRALYAHTPQRVFNVCDHTQMKMGAYYDWAADLYGLPRPPRVTRDEAPGQLSLMVLSFMNESRRLRNDRAVHELGWQLRYPTVREGLRLQPGLFGP